MIQQRIEALKRMLKSNALTIDGRLWVLNEIWDLEWEKVRNETNQR